MKLMIGNKKLGLHDTYYANSCFLSSIPKDYAYITNRIRIISPKEENYQKPKERLRMKSCREVKDYQDYKIVFL